MMLKRKQVWGVLGSSFLYCCVASASQEIIQEPNGIDEVSLPVGTEANGAGEADAADLPTPGAVPPEDAAESESEAKEEEDDEEEPTLMDSADVNTGSASTNKDFFAADYTPSDDNTDESKENN